MWGTRNLSAPEMYQLEAFWSLGQRPGAFGILSSIYLLDSSEIWCRGLISRSSCCRVSGKALAGIAKVLAERMRQRRKRRFSRAFRNLGPKNYVTNSELKRYLE